MIWTILLFLALAIVAFLFLSVFRTRSIAAEAEKKIPMMGRIVPVSGGAIHYVELGPKDGTPLVLIHGLSGQLQHFTHGLTDLLAGDFRVIAVDRPGCGYSTREDDALSCPEAQGRMISEALDKLEVDNPILVGHSLGGAVALTMALNQPEKTAALALICPATQYQDEIPEVFRGLMITSPRVRKFISRTIAVPMAVATRDRVLSMVFHPEPVPDDFMIKAGGVLGLRPQAFVTASLDAIGAQRAGKSISERYEGELRVPGGILFGAADAILSPALHGHTMQAHGLSFETLEGRGHMLPLSAPQECADFIRKIAAEAAVIPMNDNPEPALAAQAGAK